MVAFSFNVGFYAFDQFTIGGLTLTGNNNVPSSLIGATVNYQAGATFELNGSPTITTITINDDDGQPSGSPNNQFADGASDLTSTGGTATTGTNNQLLDSDITINGVFYPAGSQVELEFLFEVTSVNGTETFYIIRINGDNVGIGGATLMEPSVEYTSTGDAVDLSSVPVSEVACFTEGTLIETPDGPRAIEDLSVGDLVTTMGNGAQPIRWIGSRHVSMLEMKANRALRPVVFETGSFGNDRPLMVSQQHRMLLNDWRAQVYFGEDQVLVAAKALVNDKTIRLVTPRGGVTYLHLLFDQHEIVIAEGALSESFHPGEVGLDAMGDDQRREIETLFPELAFDGRRPACPIIKTGQVRGLDLAD